MIIANIDSPAPDLARTPSSLKAAATAPAAYTSFSFFSDAAAAAPAAYSSFSDAATTAPAASALDKLSRTRN